MMIAAGRNTAFAMETKGMPPWEGIAPKRIRSVNKCGMNRPLWRFF